MIKKNMFNIVMLIILLFIYKEMRQLVNRMNAIQLELKKLEYIIDNITIQQYRTIFFDNTKDNNKK